MELAVALTIGSFGIGLLTGFALVTERLMKARLLYIKTKRIQKGYSKTEAEESLIDESSFEVVEKGFYRLQLELPDKH